MTIIETPEGSKEAKPLTIDCYVTAQGGVVVLNGPFPIEEACRISLLCNAAPDILKAVKILLGDDSEYASQHYTDRVKFARAVLAKAL
jgi:hypothetical protein